jgi:lysophospholipase L1-like esterase
LAQRRQTTPSASRNFRRFRAAMQKLCGGNPAVRKVPSLSLEFVPERPHVPRNCSRMETAADYRKFAEECRRLARRAEDEQHKVVLEQMAEVWLRLAVEAEQKRARKPTLR